MKHVLLKSLLFGLAFLPITSHAKQAVQSISQPRIQIAILLDTSGSMSGLINQTRQQLWHVVNQFANTTQNNRKPRLEVAVYEYGNDRLSSQTGFIRQVTGLTEELDQVSEALFSLTTNGGSEYCGYVIQTAINELQWSQSNNDIKAIFIAGNEEFTQGPVPYQKSMELARNKGIVVNTIHAGDYQTGAQTGWKGGALLAHGEYMHIDHNHQIAHIEAPQDKEIARLNAELNKTYIPYGAKGGEKAQRQQEQDARTAAESVALLAKRAQSKSSGLYSNEQWDLVDAINNDRVDLDKLDKKDMPAPMVSMDASERQEYVQSHAKKRADLQKEIQQLTEARNKYVAEKQRAAAEKSVNTVDDAMVQAIRKQGESKNFVF